MWRGWKKPGADIQHEPGGKSAAARLFPLSLRTRLLLLVVASVVPLISMGVVREYWNYQAQREQAYEGLRTTARGMAVAVERDLQLRVSVLEALATSPSLQSDDLTPFDAQAEAFLARAPSGTLLGLLKADLSEARVYGPSPGGRSALVNRDTNPMGSQVFNTGRPLVTDLHVGPAGVPGFSVDVPVFRDDRVVYDLFMRLPPRDMADLINRQHLPPRMFMVVVDRAGVVVARVPNVERFLGAHVVPELAAAIQSNPEGVLVAPALEGARVVAAYTHVAPFGWSVIVGAPEDFLFAPMREAMLRMMAAGFIVLASAVVLAILAARHVTRPIETLRRLAAHADSSDRRAVQFTGLPETDTVALAVMTAAAERREAAVALAESEQRFRALFERSSSGTILMDPETTQIIDCNEAAAGILGCTVEEFRGRKVLDFRLGTSLERIREVNRSVVAGQTVRYETRVMGRKGPRDLLVAVGPLTVAGRTLVLLNQIDVTDLRTAEAGLRINEGRLELAREAANLGIWDWDPATSTLTWSEHNWSLHGLEPRPGGPTMEDWAGVVDPADLPRAREELHATLTTPGHVYACEYTVRLPDGSSRRLLGRGQAVRNADGLAVRVVGINMDVTARHEAEIARDRLISILGSERSRLAEIIEALPIGVGIVDRSGWVTVSNPIMRTLIGPVVPSMDGRVGAWIRHHPSGSLVEPEDYPIRRALRGETVLPGEDFLHQAADGTETWIRAGSLPLRWENGEVLEVLAILRDIDAEKRLMDIQQATNVRLEQRVREEVTAREAAQQRAAHAERMQALGQIAGGIAHDFNNVLQTVAGGASLIERRPNQPDRVLRHARMIADAARRGAAITSRLLTFSRRGDLRAESLDAGTLLHDIAEVLTHTLGGSVVCKVDVPGALPPLFADRGQLETVLINLATNARDAMPSGGTLTMTAEAETVTAAMPHSIGLPPGCYIRIVVGDTGIGMDDAVLARVTEPFFTTKETGKGTGLGLAMTKGFVEQSGGGLSIDSVPGRGTNVTLWLPRAPEGAVERPAGPVPATQAGAEGRHVLLVDDDTVVREVLAASLDDAGYVVLQAGSGPDALARLAAGDRVDIIVSDLAMPEMDGIILIRAAQEQRPGLPGLLLTGYAGDGAALAVGEALKGPFSLLRKPVSGLQLVDRITALLAGTVAAGI